MSRLPFATQVNFLDPKWTRDDDGNKIPYGPTRLKEIIKQNYMISKNCSTSYNNILELTPTERDYLIEFIVDEANEAQKMIQESKKRRESMINNEVY